MQRRTGSKRCRNDSITAPFVKRIQLVTLVETTAIPAASEVEVKARVCAPSDKHIWMVEGKSARLPIRVARALVRPQNNLIPLRIVNTTLTPVTIYKGSTVAQAECMDEANINVVSEKTEDEAIGPADWNPKVCSSLEGMLPKDINKDHEEKILALLELYADVIAIGDNGLGRTGILRHNIDTGNASPICQQSGGCDCQRRRKLENCSRT